MKVIGISAGNSPSDTKTLEAFLESNWSETPLGKLLIALAKETAWSGEYRVSASFGTEPRLTIFHPTFLSDQPLGINEETGIMSVKGVEDALRRHFQKSWESVEAVMCLLQSAVSRLREASKRIIVDKAEAAIVAIFPEAASAHRNHMLDTYDLSAFVLIQDDRSEQVFLARQIDGEFVCGIARIRMEALVFYMLPETEKRNSFWKALALTFAEKELGLSEGSLFSPKIEVKDKGYPWPHPAGYDPFIVREVLFRHQSTDDEIVVTFGADNLPASVTRRESGVETQAPFVSDRNSPHG